MSIVQFARFKSNNAEQVITTRYANWEAYGKVQDAVAKDADFAKLLAQQMEIAEMMGRNIAVGIDL